MKKKITEFNKIDYLIDEERLSPSRNEILNKFASVFKHLTRMRLDSLVVSDRMMGEVSFSVNLSDWISLCKGCWDRDMSEILTDVLLRINYPRYNQFFNKEPDFLGEDFSKELNEEELIEFNNLKNIYQTMNANKKFDLWYDWAQERGLC